MIARILGRELNQELTPATREVWCGRTNLATAPIRPQSQPAILASSAMIASPIADVPTCFMPGDIRSPVR